MFKSILAAIAALPKLITMIMDAILAIAEKYHAWKVKSKRKKLVKTIEDLKGINEIKDEKERLRKKAEIAKKISDIFN